MKNTLRMQLIALCRLFVILLLAYLSMACAPPPHHQIFSVPPTMEDYIQFHAVHPGLERIQGQVDKALE
jgi:hypothetical protein